MYIVLAFFFPAPTTNLCNFFLGEIFSNLVMGREPTQRSSVNLTSCIVTQRGRAQRMIYEPKTNTHELVVDKIKSATILISAQYKCLVARS